DAAADPARSCENPFSHALPGESFPPTASAAQSDEPRDPRWPLNSPWPSAKAYVAAMVRGRCPEVFTNEPFRATGESPAPANQNPPRQSKRRLAARREQRADNDNATDLVSRNALAPGTAPDPMDTDQIETIVCSARPPVPHPRAPLDPYEQALE